MTRVTLLFLSVCVAVLLPVELAALIVSYVFMMLTRWVFSLRVVALND